MKTPLVFLVAGLFVISAQTTPQAESDPSDPKISLSVSSGAPLRLYLTKRIPNRLGAPVEGKVLDPVFAFDREVIPAGTAIQGEVSRVQPASKWLRARAILNGDFTPI